MTNDLMTLRVKMRKAAKDYPAFGVTKGQQIYKWRAGGKKHISLTDPREAAPVDEAVTKLEAEVKVVAKRGRKVASKNLPVISPRGIES